MTEPMKRNWTRGKWVASNPEWDSSIQVKSQGRRVARVGINPEFYEDEEITANARLISAAPAMLEALTELVELPNKKRPTRVWDDARTALAQALES